MDEKNYRIEKIVEEDKEIEIIHEDATEYERLPLKEDDAGYFCPYCYARIRLPVPPKMCPWCHKEFKEE